MKTLLVIAVLLLAAQEQEPWTPSPGNPGHRPPPEGWHCSTNTPEVPAPEGHACECHKHCVIDQGTGERVIQEDGARCLVYCYKNSCLCAFKCEDT